jgi:phytoene dehydrogenase-like protein
MPAFEQEARILLDEAVTLFEKCSLQGSSTGEVESIACEIGRLLYQANSQNNLSISASKTPAKACQQLDQAIMLAVQDPTFVPQVESLAAVFYQLSCGEDSITFNPTVFDQFILSDAQVRLQKLNLSLTSPRPNSNIQDSFRDFSTALSASPDVKDDTAAVVFSDDKTQLVGCNQGSTQQQIEGSMETERGSTEERELFIKDDLESTADTTESISNRFSLQTDDHHAGNASSEVDEVDVAIVGAGISGLCAGAILNTVYGKKVGIYESHYLPGGCAHAFDRVAANNVTFTFDSGPTIVLGCSKHPYNPLRQILDTVGQSVKWIPYDGWGMIENPGRENELRWKVPLGSKVFQEGPIEMFGSETTLSEFEDLRELTKGLVSGAIAIPAMAMRAGKSAIVPLVRYLPALIGIIKQGERSQGTFKPYMDGPIFKVTDPWLRSWLDALAFSLSGLPASRTAAAAMAYVLYDMHRPDAALDYPSGGLGSVIDALVRGVEQGDVGSRVYLRSNVESIDTAPHGGRISGLTLSTGKRVIAKDGVICTVPLWSFSSLIKNRKAREVLNNFIPERKSRKPRQSWVSEGGVSFVRNEPEPFSDAEDSLFFKCDTAEMTGSFLHLHLAIRSEGLDLQNMEAHYTVMDRSLSGDGTVHDGPCGELNMIAVSNPCVIDNSLAPEGYMVLHAYGAGNEPYESWKDIKRGSYEYRELKEKRSQVLWRAVESIIPDVRDRVVLQLVGSPKTHERFLRRPMGTYGAATEDYLKDGSTPYETLVLAGEGIFPGIGVPAVALSGAAAANSMVSPWRHWIALDKLRTQDLI